MLAVLLMHEVLKASKKSEKFTSQFTKTNQAECVGYVIFSMVTFSGAFYLTDRRFSTLMTLGAALQCLGFCLLLLQVMRGRGTKSISVRTLVLFVLVLSSRLYSTQQAIAYVPVDRSGDWLYQAIEATSLLLAIIITCIMFKVSKDEFPQEDTFNVVPLVVLCAAGAMYYHPNLIQVKSSDASWAFSIYLEAFVMLPQLFLLTKLGAVVESFQGHYMACTFASRLAMLRLWVKCYIDIKNLDTPGSSGFCAYLILFAHIISVIVLLDFMYIYWKSHRSSKPCIIPMFAAESI